MVIDLLIYILIDDHELKSNLSNDMIVVGKIVKDTNEINKGEKTAVLAEKDLEAELTSIFSDQKYHKLKPEVKDKIKNILATASNHFRRLPGQEHPKDKAQLLIDMVKSLSDSFQSLDITVSCDLLIPIVSYIIKQNIDIVPGVEIKMTYDYLGHLTNEKGYIITVLLSSLLACLPND